MVISVDDDEECLRSLDWVGSGNRQAAIEPPYKETLGWVASNSVISDWLQCKSRILWILGKPGSGKSTLSKFLSEHIQRLKDHITPGQAILTFFFSKEGKNLDRSEEGCLRSLLYQLLQQIPQLSSYILSKYQRKKKSRIPVTWDIEEIRGLLISMLRDYHLRSIRIIIGKPTAVFYMAFQPINRQ